MTIRRDQRTTSPTTTIGKLRTLQFQFLCGTSLVSTRLDRRLLEQNAPLESATVCEWGACWRPSPRGGFRRSGVALAAGAVVEALMHIRVAVEAKVLPAAGAHQAHAFGGTCQSGDRALRLGTSVGPFGFYQSSCEPPVSTGAPMQASMLWAGMQIAIVAFYGSCMGPRNLPLGPGNGA